MNKIHYNQAYFLTSVATLAQLPPDDGIEVAFVGRSNAGKSRALNALTNINQLARISKIPGRTQLLNFFVLDEERRLVDLPGYGYARVPLEIKHRWQKTLTKYLETRKCLRGIVLIMDIRHPFKPFDYDILNWATLYQISVHVLLTKADKLSRSGSMGVLREVKNILEQYPKNLVTVQLFSAIKKTGIDEFRAKLDTWYAGT